MDAESNGNGHTDEFYRVGKAEGNLLYVEHMRRMLELLLEHDPLTFAHYSGWAYAGEAPFTLPRRTKK